MTGHRRPPAAPSFEKGGGQTEQVARHRIVQVDNLKTVLVEWIIGCHALLEYLAIGGWPYDEVQEVILHFSAYAGAPRAIPMRDVAVQWRDAQP